MAAREAEAFAADPFGDKGILSAVSELSAADQVVFSACLSFRLRLRARSVAHRVGGFSAFVVIPKSTGTADVMG